MDEFTEEELARLGLDPSLVESINFIEYILLSVCLKLADEITELKTEISKLKNHENLQIL